MRYLTAEKNISKNMKQQIINKEAKCEDEVLFLTNDWMDYEVGATHREASFVF